MSYEWKHYLNFAKGLLQNNIYADPSTNYRIAISRAYYAAYHIALAFIEVHDLPKGKAGASHERVINAYSTMNKKDNNFKSTCKKIGYNLNRLKECRRRADYEENWECTKDTAKKAVWNADTIISSVEKLENDYFRKVH